MKEAEKSLASKTEVRNALDLGDKNIEKLQIFEQINKSILTISKICYKQSFS